MRVRLGSVVVALDLSPRRGRRITVHGGVGRVMWRWRGRGTRFFGCVGAGLGGGVVCKTGFLDVRQKLGSPDRWAVDGVLGKLIENRNQVGPRRLAECLVEFHNFEDLNYLEQAGDCEVGVGVNNSAEGLAKGGDKVLHELILLPRSRRRSRNGCNQRVRRDSRQSGRNGFSIVNAVLLEGTLLCSNVLQFANAVGRSQVRWENR